MGRLGTDVLALACIVGGAAVGGAATLVALERSGDDRGVEVDAVEACAMVVHAPDVEVRLHDGEIRVGPSRAPRIRARQDCRKIGRRITIVRTDRRDLHREREVRARVEEARRRAAEARARAEELRNQAEVRRLKAEHRRLDVLRQRFERQEDRARAEEALRVLELQQQALESRIRARRDGNR